ncbi:MAG: molecular chaperone TorD family protein [Verrucomicrobia bacterium]|nr:molecular chaperone TorD family protein [Verrucomicrobiota bacterium]
MPTPSESVQSPESKVQSREWAARTDTPKRSVFGNYRGDGAPSTASARSDSNAQQAETVLGAPLQFTIDLAVARSFIHRFLAKAYEDPMPQTWRWLTQARTINSLRAANVFAGQSLLPSAEVLINALQPAGYDAFLNAYLAAFGHAARGSCPLNEIEYGDIKADPLFQPHRLADLAAFYRAFGLEVTEDAGERQDHLCLELEFLCVLAAKEAYALEHQLDADQLTQCREAQKKFLREHLGRWTPAFARRLASATNEPALRALAEFTRAVIESECARFGVNPGSEELSLRPVDEAADRACDSCGINNLPPGALAAEAVT